MRVLVIGGNSGIADADIDYVIDCAREALKRPRSQAEEITSAALFLQVDADVGGARLA